MMQDEILTLFRTQAAQMPQELPTLGDLVRDLSQLLADSRGKLSKENFDSLVQIGAVLYKAGLEQFNARQSVSDIMQRAAHERGPR